MSAKLTLKGKKKKAGAWGKRVAIIPENSKAIRRIRIIFKHGY